MPIDMLRYETDSFSANNLAMLKDDDPYWTSLRNAYGEGLSGLVKMLPPPPSWGVYSRSRLLSRAHHTPSVMSLRASAASPQRMILTHLPGSRSL